MYRFKILDCFKKDLKKFLKKFPSLKSDLIQSLKGFKKTKAISLGNNNYKIRLISSDLNKGKSGGFRRIIHLYRI